MDPSVYFKISLDDFKEHEYDAQLFGFTIEDFMRAIKILVKDEVTRFAEAMTHALLKKYSENDPEIDHVKNLTKSLIDQYICASVGPFNNLETQLKELLHIPSHILMPKDEVQRSQYSSEEEKELDDQIKDLLNSIKRTKSFDVELRQELKMLRDFLPLMSKKLQELEQVDELKQASEMIVQQLSTVEAINNDMEQIHISE